MFLKSVKKELSVKKLILILIILGVSGFVLSQTDSFTVTLSYFNDQKVQKLTKKETEKYKEIRKENPDKLMEIKDDLIRYSLRLPSHNLQKLSYNDEVTQKFKAEDPYLKRVNIIFANPDSSIIKGDIDVNVEDKNGKKICSTALKAGLVRNDGLTRFDFTENSDKLNKNYIVQKNISFHKAEGISVKKGEEYTLRIKCKNIGMSKDFGIYMCDNSDKYDNHLSFNGKDLGKPLLGTVSFLHVNKTVYIIFIVAFILAILMLLLPLSYFTEALSRKTGKDRDINIFLSRVLFIVSPFAAFFIICKGQGFRTTNIIYLLLSFDGFLNIFILTGILLLAYLIINRTKYATILLIGAAFVFSLTNYLLIQFRNSPLVAADFASVGTAMDVAANYSIVFTKSIFWVIVTSTIYLCFVIALKSYKGLQARKRIAFALACTLFAGTGFWLIFSENAPSNSIKISGFEPKRSYAKHGSTLSFVLTLKASRIEKPDDYSVEYVKKITKEYNSDIAVKAKKTNSKSPNIIVIMNEAFSDLSYVGPFKTSGPYMPFFNSLTENTVRGTLHTSVFGGNTANTEYEFLTGNTLAFMPMYIVAYNSKVPDNSPSLARTLTDDGYGGNIAFHPGMSNSYNRNVVYPNLGFKKHIADEDLKNPDKIRAYVSDEYDFKKVISEYEKYRKNNITNPFWLFNVTIQNHSDFKYTSGVVEKRVVITDDSAKEEQAEQYLNLISITDDAFKMLVEYFDQIDEPTVILMFGDHQPRVGDSFYSVLESRNKYNSYIEKREGRFKVPFIMWANYDIKEENNINISANYLGSYLLKKLKLPMTGYDKYLMDLYKEVPVVSAICYMDKDKKIHALDDETNYSKHLTDYQCIQYNNVADYENRIEDFFTLK